MTKPGATLVAVMLDESGCIFVDYPKGVDAITVLGQLELAKVALMQQVSGKGVAESGTGNGKETVPGTRGYSPHREPGAGILLPPVGLIDLGDGHVARDAG